MTSSYERRGSEVVADIGFETQEASLAEADKTLVCFLVELKSEQWMRLNSQDKALEIARVKGMRGNGPAVIIRCKYEGEEQEWVCKVIQDTFPHST